MASLPDVPPPPSLSALSRQELEALLVDLFGEVAALKQMNGDLREEIARLKGLKGRPTIKSSGMDRGSEPPKPDRPEKRPGRSDTSGQYRRGSDQSRGSARLPLQGI